MRACAFTYHQGSEINFFSTGIFYVIISSPATPTSVNSRLISFAPFVRVVGAGLAKEENP